MLLTVLLAEVGIGDNRELANERNRSIGIDLRNSLLKAKDFLKQLSKTERIGMENFLKEYQTKHLKEGDDN